MLKLTSSLGNEIWKFDSVTEMEQQTDPKLAEDFLDNPSFIGRQLQNYDQLKGAINTSWEDGIRIMEEFVTKLENSAIPEIKSLKARRKYNSGGEGEIDTDRFLSGNYDYAYTIQKEAEGKAPEITIVIDCTGSCTIDSMDLLWRGAAAIALTKILEGKGYRCEIWACSGSRFYQDHPDRGVVVATQLKKTSDPLDVSTLINTVSGWFFRTEMFTLWTTIAHRQNKALAWALGTCYSLTESELDLLTVDEKRIYSTGVFSFNGALNLMLNLVRKIADQE